MSRHASRCRACDEARRQELSAAAAPIIASGKCPKCSRKLRRNLSLAGWFQCGQFGAEQFRTDASQPSCNFQIFA